MPKPLLLLIALAVDVAIAADPVAPPECPWRPGRLEINIPAYGITWLDREELSDPCDDVPAEAWTQLPTKPSEMWAHAEGPGGSGRFWTITVGLTDEPGAAPARGFCLTTSTVGWRTLQRYDGVPLPWVADLDEDGRPEFLRWASFPLTEDPTMVEYGLVAWVYELNAEDVLVVDWELTRRKASELARAYRQPLDDRGLFSELRDIAAAGLQALADGKCAPAGADPPT